MHPQSASSGLMELLQIMASETALVLATRPQDAAGRCATLIAAACARARPPIVAVLTDGSAASPGEAPHSPDWLARMRERQVRAAMASAGLARPRLMLLGLHDGTAPCAGELFERVVAAIIFLMWSRDCNVIVAPALPAVGPAWSDQRAAHMAALAVAAHSGVSFATLDEG